MLEGVFPGGGLRHLAFSRELCSSAQCQLHPSGPTELATDNSACIQGGMTPVGTPGAVLSFIKPSFVTRNHLGRQLGQRRILCLTNWGN